MSSWYESQTIRSLDFEATGVDPTQDHVVTAAVVDIHPDRRPEVVHWTLDPGVDIPAEATEVHGYTRDRVLELVGAPGMALRVGDGKSDRMPVDAALFEIAMLVAQAMGREIPVVVANAPYDLTLLEAELGRYGVDSLASRPSGVCGVVDPMVIDRAFDTYRKSCYKAPGCDPETGVHECGGCRGSRHHDCGGCGVTDRKLESLCRHYRVPLVGAHDAAADALAAARLAVRLGGLWKQIARWKLPTLHEHQVTWRREQSDSLREFWRKKGDERWREVDGDWPVRRTPAVVGVAS
jgi:DNA polymerase-3 subunit epsilon